MIQCKNCYQSVYIEVGRSRGKQRYQGFIYIKEHKGVQGFSIHAVQP